MKIIFSCESLHGSLQIFFLDSVGLRHILPPEAVTSLPVVLRLQPQLLQPAGGAGLGAGRHPGRGHHQPPLALHLQHGRGDLSRKKKYKYFEKLLEHE